MIRSNKFDFKLSTFPGGELYVQLLPNDDFLPNGRVEIYAELTNTEELWRLALIKNAIDENYKQIKSVDLYLPYIPYGRQDRVCKNGESFSLKVFANFLNSCLFDNVYVMEPHSDVSRALIANLNVMNIDKSIVESILNVTSNDQGGHDPAKIMFLSPDEGAKARTDHIAREVFGNNGPFRTTRASKYRRPGSVEIKLHEAKLDETVEHVVVFDDICDGGRTFLSLKEEAVKFYPNAKFHLIVVFGIFSAGMEVLLKEYATVQAKCQFWPIPKTEA